MVWTPRRIVRRLFRDRRKVLLIAVAAVFVATVLLALRSFYKCDVLWASTSSRDLAIQSHHGALVMYIGSVDSVECKRWHPKRPKWRAARFSYIWSNMTTDTFALLHLDSVPIISGRFLRELHMSPNEMMLEPHIPWIDSARYGRFGSEFVLRMPYWIPLLVLSVPLLLARSRARRASRRSRLGLCPACGYDLTGTPGRCPECGWAADGPGSHPASPTEGSPSHPSAAPVPQP